MMRADAKQIQHKKRRCHAVDKGNPEKAQGVTLQLEVRTLLTEASRRASFLVAFDRFPPMLGEANTDKLVPNQLASGREENRDAYRERFNLPIERRQLACTTGAIRYSTIP